MSGHSCQVLTFPFDASSVLRFTFASLREFFLAFFGFF